MPLKLTLTVTHHEWKPLATPVVLTLEWDAEKSVGGDLGRYLTGDPGVKAVTCYQAMKGPNASTVFTLLSNPRVLAWRYRKGQQDYLVANVVNESIEQPLGWIRGTLKSEWGGKTTEHPCDIGDQGSVRVTYGTPFLNVDLKALEYFNRTHAWLSPPQFKYFSQRWHAPDRQEGQLDWPIGLTPTDKTDYKDSHGINPYAGDGRNPSVLAEVGHLPIPRDYGAQTHAHTSDETGSRVIRLVLDYQKLGQTARVDEMLVYLQDFMSGQEGGWAPYGEGFVGSRPNHLSLVDGSPFEFGHSYTFTDTDRKAPKKYVVIHEGRPEIGKSGLQLTQCLGRDKVSWLTLRAGQYAGQYIAANGSDPEHDRTRSGNLVAAAILLGDISAKRGLFHMCQEIQSNKDYFHSTRSLGWDTACLLAGVIVFHDARAATFMQAARDLAHYALITRIDEPPYQGLLGVAYEKMDTSQEERTWWGSDSTMQLAVALAAFVTGARIDPDPIYQAVWRELVQYTALCLAQPGIIDESRGGILPRYPFQGPDPTAPIDPATGKPSIPIGLEMRVPNWTKRTWQGAEGWLGGPLADAALLLVGVQAKDADPNLWHDVKKPPLDRIASLARFVRDHQAAENLFGVPALSEKSMLSYGWSHGQSCLYGPKN